MEDLIMRVAALEKSRNIETLTNTINMLIDNNKTIKKLEEFDKNKARRLEKLEDKSKELEQLIKSEVEDMNSAEKHDVNMITSLIDKLEQKIDKLQLKSDALYPSYHKHFVNNDERLDILESVLRKYLENFVKNAKKYIDETEREVAGVNEVEELIKQLGSEDDECEDVRRFLRKEQSLEYERKEQGLGAGVLPYDYYTNPYYNDDYENKPPIRPEEQEPPLASHTEDIDKPSKWRKEQLKHQKFMLIEKFLADLRLIDEAMKE